MIVSKHIPIRRLHLGVRKPPRTLNRMDTGNFADYAFGSGSQDITFIYTVQEGDSSVALDAWDAPNNGELSVRS